MVLVSTFRNERFFFGFKSPARVKQPQIAWTWEQITNNRTFNASKILINAVDHFGLSHIDNVIYEPRSWLTDEMLSHWIYIYFEYLQRLASITHKNKCL